jgi:hypothetical protein
MSDERPRWDERLWQWVDTIAIGRVRYLVKGRPVVEVAPRYDDPRRTLLEFGGSRRREGGGKLTAWRSCASID